MTLSFYPYPIRAGVGVFQHPARSGITHIRDWRDAAHLIAPLRKMPQEQALAVVVAKDGRPLAVIRHSIGDSSSSIVDGHALAGTVAMVPDAHAVYFAHQHPGGNPTQSEADIALEKRLSELLRGSGIENRGMIVVAPGSKSATLEWHPEEGASVHETGAIHAHARHEVVAQLERRFTKIRGSKPEDIIDTPVKARALVRSNDTQRGLWLLNHRHLPVGFLPMDDAEMAKLRTGDPASGTARGLRAAAESNANAYVIVADSPAGGANLFRLLNNADDRGNHHVLDIFTERPDGTLMSAEEEKGMPLHGPFFSRSQRTREAYDRRIDELYNNEAPPARKGVRVLDRADILGLLGYGDKPLHLVESEIEESKYNHLMTASDWKKVPEWIEHPVAAFKSDTHSGRVVLIGPELVGGKPVEIVLDPNKGMAGMDVHVLVNAYEKTHPEKAPVARWVNEQKLRYLNENESPAFGERSGLRLPRDARQLRGYKHRVLTQHDLVKYRSEHGEPPVGDGSRLESVPSAAARALTTPEVRRILAKSRLGRQFAALERAGILRFESHPDQDWDGYWDGDKAVLNTARIGEKGAFAVAMHELGGHAGLRAMVGPDVFDKIVADLKALALSKTAAGKLVARAMLRIEAAHTPADQFDQELVAYTIEEALREGKTWQSGKLNSILMRLFNRLRAWAKASRLGQAGAKVGVTPKFTPTDLAALADSAVRHLGREARGVEPERVPQEPAPIRGEMGPLYQKGAVSGSFRTAIDKLLADRSGEAPQALYKLRGRPD